MRWHRNGFHGLLAMEIPLAGGRPRIAQEVRDLIRRMSFENPPWGATKIYGDCSNSASRSPSEGSCSMTTEIWEAPLKNGFHAFLEVFCLA